jgi:hypothetical protein
MQGSVFESAAPLYCLAIRLTSMDKGDLKSIWTL